MSLRKPSSQKFEDLNILFPNLCRYSTRCFQYLGCIYPDQCGTDVVTRYLFDRKPKIKGRSEIEGDQLRLDFPDAENQLSVLRKYLKYEVIHQRFRCEDCEHKNKIRPIAEDSQDDGDESRITPAVLCSPVTPLDILEAKQQLERSLEAIPNPLHRQYVIEQAEGRTCAEIGRQFSAKSSTVRQSIHRAKLKMAASLGIQMCGSRGK
jgi:hypothetical protein